MNGSGFSLFQVRFCQNLHFCIMATLSQLKRQIFEDFTWRETVQRVDLQGTTKLLNTYKKTKNIRPWYRKIVNKVSAYWNCQFKYFEQK